MLEEISRYEQVNLEMLVDRCGVVAVRKEVDRAVRYLARLDEVCPNWRDDIEAFADVVFDVEADIDAMSE